MRSLPLRSLFSRTTAALVGAATLFTAVPADAKERHKGNDWDDDRGERHERYDRHGYRGHGNGYGGHGYAAPRYAAPRYVRPPVPFLPPFLPPLPPPPWQWGRWQPGWDGHQHAPGCGHRGYGYAYRRPVYYDHAYYCERCNHGWRGRDDFYSHVYYQHQVPWPSIPGVVVNVGAAWVFGY